MSNRIAVATLVSLVAITIGDAPRWSMKPYIGLVGSMAVASLISEADKAVGEGIALLVMSAILLRRGKEIAGIGVDLVGGK